MSINLSTLSRNELIELSKDLKAWKKIYSLSHKKADILFSEWKNNTYSSRIITSWDINPDEKKYLEKIYGDVFPEGKKNTISFIKDSWLKWWARFFYGNDVIDIALSGFLKKITK